VHRQVVDAQVLLRQQDNGKSDESVRSLSFEVLDFD
jgi:hypothetical protein